MELPNVTVIIVNHNYGQYISEAIESALRQNYPKDKLNVFVVDDASTDNSVDIIEKEFFGDINKLKLSTLPIHKTNINGVNLTYFCLKDKVGPSMARNIAIQNTITKTDVYAILDADDVYYPEKVFQCIDRIMQSEDIGIVYTDYDILNVETGNIVREFKEPYSKSRLLEDCIVHSGAIIRKEALQAVNENGQYYDNEMRTCEDYDLFIRISEKFIIVHVPEALSLVRVHRNNSTSTVSKEIWNSNWQRIRDKLQIRHG